MYGRRAANAATRTTFIFTINFTASVDKVALLWGGHIAERDDWGLNNSAVAVSGSPYHMRFSSWKDGTTNTTLNGGNQDRSLSAEAVLFPASITIVKDAVPNDAQDFNFSTTGGLSPSTFVLDDDAASATPLATRAFSGLLSFTTYTVSETAIPGWELTFGTPVCTVTSPNSGTQSASGSTVTVNLAEGENVNCVFTNTRRGTIVIDKTAVGGNDTFGYTATGTDLGNFNITTSGGTGTQTFTNVRPGAKTILESAPPTGWVFTSLVCSDPGDSGTTTTGQTANIDLDPGETVTCTYTNTKQGTVVINKTAVGGDATFAYTGTGAGVSANFNIITSGGSGSQTFTNIAPGAKTVTESAPPAGWNFTSLTCSDPGDNGTTTAGQGATIDLDAGETVTCTYTNSKEGAPSITVVKTNDANGNSTYTDSESMPEPGGTVPFKATITNNSSATDPVMITSLSDAVGVNPATMTGLVCKRADDSTIANLNSFVIAPGETVTCTYTRALHRQRGRLRDRHLSRRRALTTRARRSRRSIPPR